MLEGFQDWFVIFQRCMFVIPNRNYAILRNRSTYFFSRVSDGRRLLLRVELLSRPLVYLKKNLLNVENGWYLVSSGNSLFDFFLGSMISEVVCSIF